MNRLLLLCLLLLCACASHFSETERATQLTDAKREATECVADLERLVRGAELVAATHPVAAGDVADETVRVRCEKLDKQACLDMGRRHAKRFDAAGAFEWYRRACDLDDRAACHAAMVTRALATPAGEIADVSPPSAAGDKRVAQSIQDFRSKLTRCIQQPHEGCSQLRYQMHSAFLILQPYACSWGDDHACSDMRTQYGVRGEDTIMHLPPALQQNVIPRCDETDCASWYESRADAARDDRRLDVRQRRATSWALYRKACELAPDTQYMACAKLAGFRKPQPLSAIRHLIKACRRGRCKLLADYFYDDLRRQTNLGKQPMGRRRTQCATAIFRQSCFSGEAESCARLHRFYNSRGYGVRKDKRLAARYKLEACRLGHEHSCEE